MFRRCLFVWSILPTPILVAADEWSAARFDREVAPLLARRCLECHSGAEPKGGLDLTTREMALRGGESGTAVKAGASEASLLWQRIAADEMPPDKPLTQAEKAVVRSWLDGGVVWGTSPIDPFKTTTDSRAGYDWWSLQPIKRPEVPDLADGRNEIDAFVRAKLRAHDLKPSPAASPQVIVRRLSFDLIGLPPTPGEVAEFETAYTRDTDAAIRELVDRLLASRHFGERWGRHWLDVVRFGESQGFERDKLRPHAWHYRDWVIQALNDDMPYDQFVRLQLAGDVVRPDDPAAVTATGFLVAGPWDEVGQSMRSAAMKAVVRQDEIEDYVGTIGQTFLALTVNCARCHDHKFDPIRQQEYYQLASAVAGARHGNREVTSVEDRDRTEEINADIRRLEDEIAGVDASVRNRLLKERQQGERLPPRVRPIARWDFERDLKDSIGATHATQHPKAKIANGRLLLDGDTGYAATELVDFDLREKTLEAWVRLDDLDQRAGAAISIQGRELRIFDAIVYAERRPKKWMAGSDFFKRTKDLAAADESVTDAFVHMAITYAADGTISVFRNGKPYGEPYQTSPPVTFVAGQWKVVFGLRTGGPSPNRQLRGQLEAAQLYDRALTAEQVQASFVCEQAEITHDSILAGMSADEKTRRDALTAQVDKLVQLRQQHAPYMVYAVKPQAAETAHVLLRGNPANKAEVVSPGGVAAVPGATADFGLASDSPDAQRRTQLARWITDSNNPLFARAIVNRLWHYHFGVGIVATPNDFGFNGGRPSHAELLDWLAAELVDSGWSLKHIHRLIVSSATYLQASRHRSDCAEIDADNRLLWRKTPRRLEAEALRDAILSVSGQLNPQYGGPSYRDFTTFISNSQFYDMVDEDKPEVYRRTVYRTWLRSGRNYMLDAFDCPDPSTTAPKRAVTTTPIQSLTLLNNSFVLRMSDRFAERVARDVGDELAAQTYHAYQLAYGRHPTDDEADVVGKFIAEHGLAAFCRVVFNSNEFIYVD